MQLYHNRKGLLVALQTVSASKYHSVTLHWEYVEGHVNAFVGVLIGGQIYDVRLCVGVCT